jgi:hypothetical protein
MRHDSANYSDTAFLFIAYGGGTLCLILLLAGAVCLFKLKRRVLGLVLLSIPLALIAFFLAVRFTSSQ